MCAAEASTDSWFIQKISWKVQEIKVDSLEHTGKFNWSRQVFLEEANPIDLAKAIQFLSETGMYFYTQTEMPI